MISVIEFIFYHICAVRAPVIDDRSGVYIQYTQYSSIVVQSVYVHLDNYLCSYSYCNKIIFYYTSFEC